MSFPKYPAYRDSGVAWLGEVPAHWEVVSVGSLSSKIGSGKTPLGGSEVYCTDGVLFLRSQNVYDHGLELSDVVYIPPGIDESMSSSRVSGSDVLLNITGASLGRSCIVPESMGVANVNQHVCIIRFLNKSVAGFMSWAIKSRYAKMQMDYIQNGAAREGLNFRQISRLITAWPPPSEQDEICTFLDRETARIDGLVAEQERLIALLREKRQTVISHAVTKGLDPSAPMKDSGVAWLGEVPAHWTANRLKHLSPRVTVGIVVNPSIYVTEDVSDGLPFLYGGDIREGKIDWKNARRIPAAASQENAKTRLHTGDLITVRVGAPGVTAVVPPECDGGNCASVMLIRRGDFESPWLCYVMNTAVVRSQVEVVQYGAAQEQFNISHAVNFWVSVPPRSEQQAIVAYLDTETARIDGLIAEAERAMALLQERRAALISAAVTGQIDVRGLAAEEAA